MTQGISVVIPCLNEESSIADVIRAARIGLDRSGFPGEVLVVDNGSEDRSAERAVEAGARVVCEPERGYGAALRKGFSEARYAFLVMADGDLTYDLTALSVLVTPLREGVADFVIGNRLNRVHRGAMPRLHRYLGTPLLTRMTRLLFGRLAVDDTQCGMRAIRREAYERLRCKTTGMEFASEMIAKAALEGLRIVQRDIEYHPRTGESKLRPVRDGWRHIRFLLLYVPSPAILLPLLLLWLLTAAGLMFLGKAPVRMSSRAGVLHGLLLLAILNVSSLQVLTGAMTARIYAHLNGFRTDRLIAWLYRHLRLGITVAVGGACFLSGLAGILVFDIQTLPRTRSLGDVDSARILLLSLCLIINGLQVALAGYLASVLAVPRREEPCGAENEKSRL